MQNAEGAAYVVKAMDMRCAQPAWVQLLLVPIWWCRKGQNCSPYQ